LKFESVKPAKLSEVIVDQIEQLILKGVLVPGEKLPPERELAKQFEVSRPPLREALMRLEAKNLIYTRRGGGTYVSDPTAQMMTDPLSELIKKHPETVMDILELRHALEEMAAFYAAQRATQADLDLIQHRFDAMIQADSTSDLLAESKRDLDFHLAIADASHNVALIHVMRSLFKLLHDSIHGNLVKLYQKVENFEVIKQQHLAILEAILCREPNRARQAAHEHLLFVSESMQALDREIGRIENSQLRLDRLVS
jgi:GntR family transcriptional repressor for pyruvate dehydrogenase complex